MPDYLPVAEYVERYGEAETARLTDDTPANPKAVDEAKVEAEIDAAEEFANGYLRQRYALPIAPPPAILKGIVGALTREGLHKARPTPAVTEAADRARSTLKDLSAGRMTLLVDNVPVETDLVAPGLPQSAQGADMRVFSADKLSRY